MCPTRIEGNLFMKKLLIITAVGFLIVISGLIAYHYYNQSAVDSLHRIDFLSCSSADDYEGAFLDPTGQLFPVSQKIDWGHTPVINGYGLINNTLYKVGKSMADTVAIVRNVACCGVMSEGLMPISKTDDYITIIDRDGNEVEVLKKIEGQEIRACYCYSDSRLRVQLADNTYAFVDVKGKQLFDKRFAWATDFKKGHAVVQHLKQNEDLYDFIDENAHSVFTFESEDNDYITISADKERLTAKQNDLIVIYDFQGKIVQQCPSYVEGIYAFLDDAFIFYNEDDEYGLMSYEGKSLIRAKYEHLVPVGDNFLALVDDDDELVKLVDAEDRTLKEFEGEEICDFKHWGYDYPAMIKTSTDHFAIIDENGEIVKDDLNIDFNCRHVENYAFVYNDYFPKNEVIAEIMDLCSNGNGVQGKYGAFFAPDEYCLPSDISFLSTFSKKELEGVQSAGVYISTGVNYTLSYNAVFDMSIVLKGESDYNGLAWLMRTDVEVVTGDAEKAYWLFNQCVSKLTANGCQTYHQAQTGSILYNKDQTQLLVLMLNRKSKKILNILMMPNKERARQYWIEQLK